MKIPEAGEIIGDTYSDEDDIRARVRKILKSLGLNPKKYYVDLLDYALDDEVNRHAKKSKIFRVTASAVPRDYKTAIILLKKQKEIEAYRNKITKGNDTVIRVVSIDGFSASHLPSRSYMKSELKAPEFVAFAKIEVSSLSSEAEAEQMEPIVKRELIKILRSVGINTSSTDIETFVDTTND